MDGGFSMDIECRQWIQHMDSELRRWMGEQNALNSQLIEKLAKLEQENKQLTDKLSEVRPIRVDAIHYKVQELSVRELSGTLNIGLSALTSSEEIAKWAANLDDSPNDAAGDAALSDLEANTQRTNNSS
jgi:hypothetical protein